MSLENYREEQALMRAHVEAREFELTKEEQNAINALKRLAKRWPKSLWLFYGDGTLCVMRRHEDGSRAETRSGGVDQDYVVDEIDIPGDGGGW